MDAAAPQGSQLHSKNPVKWSEIKSALDPQELPDLPLLSQEISYLKCRLCSSVYYSTINFRRHEGFHVRRRNNPDWLPETMKNNSSLTQFWHQHLKDTFKDIVSLQDVELKGVTGQKIVEELALIPEPNIRLPPSYFTARNLLLGTIKSEEPEFSIYPDKFLAILSKGSEDTFLLSDTDESVQNFVFRDAGKIALAQENLVATACFLLEQKLRKAWHRHREDESISLRNELIKEEEDYHTERQHQTERNKVEGKKKKKKKPKKQIKEDKSEEGEPWTEIRHTAITAGAFTRCLSNP
uniref:C2H2-type domain-containing protein n=1 Tax=Kalanchoe fedtschenkoi TaxID=63787 RepID=A0A7N0UEB9_KALFE